MSHLCSTWMSVIITCFIPHLKGLEHLCCTAEKWFRAAVTEINLIFKMCTWGGSREIKNALRCNLLSEDTETLPAVIQAWFRAVLRSKCLTVKSKTRHHNCWVNLDQNIKIDPFKHYFHFCLFLIWVILPEFKACWLEDSCKSGPLQS